MRSACAVCLFAFASVSALAQMSHEENVVRTAYAQLAYAVDLHHAFNLITTKPEIDAASLLRAVDSQALRFQLSNFKAGNLSDLSREKYPSVLGQYPDGQDVIQVALSRERWEGNGTPLFMDTATAQWVQGPGGTAPNSTIGELMPTLQKE